MQEQEFTLQLQKRLTNQILETAGLSRSGKLKLIDYLLKSEARLGEISRVLPGLMALYQCRFQKLGFYEKFGLLNSLQEQLKADDGDGPLHISRMLQIIFDESGSEKGESVLPMQKRLVSRIKEIARTDPYPRVQLSAVLVLIRFGDPGVLGCCLEDYLPGLMQPDVVSACAVLHFIMRHYGSGALKPVILHIGRLKKPVPVALLRLIEAFCEDSLKGLDVKWALIQIKGFATEQGEAVQTQATQLNFGFLPDIEKARRRSGAPSHPGSPRRKSQKKRRNAATEERGTMQEDVEAEENSKKSLAKRFSRIRSEHATSAKGVKSCPISPV